jgi:hypothetical protein
MIQCGSCGWKTNDADCLCFDCGYCGACCACSDDYGQTDYAIDGAERDADEGEEP